MIYKFILYISISISLYAHHQYIPINQEYIQYELNEDSSSYKVLGGGVQNGILVIPETYNDLPVTKIAEQSYDFGSNNVDLTKVVLPETIIEIGRYAFDRARNLSEINFPNSIATIGYAAFYDCDSLTEVTLPNALTVLNGTFLQCDNLRDIIIPNGVTSILNGALNETDVRVIDIPASVNSIGEYSLYSHSLENIRFYGNCPNFGNRAINTGSNNLIISYVDGNEGFDDLSIFSWPGGGNYNVSSELLNVSPVLNVADSFYIMEGDSQFIDAYPISGFPSEFTYQWEINGFAIPAQFGGTNSSFMIDGIASNQGIWKVEVANVSGNSSHVFDVIIVRDSDLDGVYDHNETNTGIFISQENTGTDPSNQDSDGDTILDGIEITNGSDPNLADTDSDGLDDSQEETYGTDPNLADTSGDGLKDGEIVNLGFDPTIDYTNLKDAIVQGIKDLRSGSYIIEVSSNQATVHLQLEESTDLQSWEDVGTPATMTIPADTDTKFFRFKMGE